MQNNRTTDCAQKKQLYEVITDTYKADVIKVPDEKTPRYFEYALFSAVKKILFFIEE